MFTDDEDNNIHQSYLQTFRFSSSPLILSFPRLAPMADLPPRSFVTLEGHTVYFCQICELWLNGHGQLIDHLVDPIHKRKLRRRERQMRRMAEDEAQKERELVRR